ncbi:MAG TPA: peptidylprolyl isomerase [Steroidobacteraceae bacterium]|nr:peptidylprolyl isomerase [Steroidobacteraceae bacterium]
MLQKIGDTLKGHKWLSWILLGALALVFAAWGAYGIVNLNFGGSNYAAEANGSKIALEDARSGWLRQQAQWQQRLGGAELPPQLRTQLQNQVLEGLIRNALLTERTQDLGYRVSRTQLREAIQNEPAFQIDGQYSPEAAKAALAQAGLSLETFEQELGTDVQRMQLEGGIRASGFLTAAELKRLADLEDQEREVRYFVLPADQFKSAAKTDDAAVQAYYQAHQSQYLTPESAHLQYAELRLETLAAQQTVTDADLHTAYDKEKSRLELPEKRHAHHILITGKDDAAALAQAQQVLAQAKAGKDFGALAKQYSQDPGSAASGGDLGWAERASFVKPFADTLFSMKVGDIAGPVKTQFGYHIIRLDEIQAGNTKSFEQARAELETQVRRNLAADRFGEIQEQLQSKIGDPGVELGALAQEYHLQQGDVADFAKGTGGAPLGPAPALQELVFGEPALGVGKLGGPVLLGDDRLVIVKEIDHRKPQPKPLAEVRDSIVAALVKEQSSQAALKAAQGAVQELNAGASFDSVAQKFKLTADPAHFVSRRDPSIPIQVRDAAFAAARPSKPEFSAVSLNDGGAAVFALSAVRTAKVQDAKDQSDRALQQAQRLGTADVLAYVDEVRRTADVRKNPKAFE